MSVWPLTSKKMPDGARRSGFEIVCAGCKVDDFLNSHGNAWPADQVRQHFQHRGWRVDARGQHKCRDCDQRETAAAREARKLARPIKPAETPVTVSPSPDASKGFVDVVLLLSDHYDKAAKKYRGHWSDAKIAKDTGIAEAVVSETREARFGPLIVDTFEADVLKFANYAAFQNKALFARLEGVERATAELRALLARDAGVLADFVGLVDKRRAKA